ncbi:MAG: FAD-dependent oxidoreductase [Chthoniobacterales bacterium]
MSATGKILEENLDVLIVGAGMTGLTAASELRRAGRSVVLLDKGRGVGGRMATHRIGRATFDHGAQFFTARDPRFAAAIENWQEIGIAAEWSRGITAEADGHARWRGQPGMTAVPKHLAHGLSVRTETKVVSLGQEAEHWWVETETGEVFRAGALLLTAPVPQSLALLDAGRIPLQPEIRASLTSIIYERCLTVLAVLAGPPRVPAPGGFAPTGGPITWTADNQQKGISTEPAVTIHASQAFSLERWDRDRAASGRLLLEAAQQWLGAQVLEFEVHGWRYSKPLRVAEQPCMILSTGPPLVLAGDAFAGPRVEGAALSGWAAAEALLESDAMVPRA